MMPERRRGCVGGQRSVYCLCSCREYGHTNSNIATITTNTIASHKGYSVPPHLAPNATVFRPRFKLREHLIEMRASPTVTRTLEG